MRLQEAASRIPAADDSRIDRNPPQERNTHFEGEPLATSGSEQIGMDATLRTDIPAHVFEHARDGQIGFPANCDAPPHIRDGQFLGCRYNDRGRRAPSMWGVSMPVFGVLGYTLLGIVIIAESLFSARLARWAGYAPGKRNKPTRRSDPIPRIGHFGHIRIVVSRYACRSEVRVFRMRRALSISDQTPGCTYSCTTPR